MIIGIGGASRSGKSRLAKKIKSLRQDQNVNIIRQDDFVFEEEDIPKTQGVTDWEHPSSIDFQRMAKAIDLSTKQFEIIIVEGFLIYFDEKITDKMDYKIFLEIDESNFLKRKLEDRRWGKTPMFYIKHIWKSYLKFGQVNPETMNLYLDTSTQYPTEIDLAEILNNHS